jgi:hypothetical protein
MMKTASGFIQFNGNLDARLKSFQAILGWFSPFSAYRGFLSFQEEAK